MWKKRIVIALVAAMAAFVVLLSGCGSADSTQKEKILRVGSETTFPPFEFTDGDKYVGFDIDLSEAIAKQMGYKMEFKSMGFDALIPALQSGQIDMIAAGLDPTPARAKQVGFSDVYFKETGYSIIVRKDENGVNDFSDLTGKVIGAQVGTKPVEIGQGIEGTTVKQFDTNSQLFLELTHNNIDAIILDKAVGMYYLKQGADKELKMVGPGIPSSGMVLAVKKENTELQQNVNKALQELKDNGGYQKIYEKWFGTQK